MFYDKKYYRNDYIFIPLCYLEKKMGRLSPKIKNLLFKSNIDDFIMSDDLTVSSLRCIKNAKIMNNLYFFFPWSRFPYDLCFRLWKGRVAIRGLLLNRKFLYFYFHLFFIEILYLIRKLNVFKGRYK